MSENKFFRSLFGKKPETPGSQPDDSFEALKKQVEQAEKLKSLEIEAVHDLEDLFHRLDIARVIQGSQGPHPAMNIKLLVLQAIFDEKNRETLLAQITNKKIGDNDERGIRDQVRRLIEMFGNSEVAREFCILLREEIEKQKTP
jgi:hypothetical protein